MPDAQPSTVVFCSNLTQLPVVFSVTVNFVICIRYFLGLQFGIGNQLKSAYLLLCQPVTVLYHVLLFSNLSCTVGLKIDDLTILTCLVLSTVVNNVFMVVLQLLYLCFAPKFIHFCLYNVRFSMRCLLMVS